MSIDDPATWEKAKDLITEALRRPSADREAFLRERCADAALREEVAALVRQYDDAPDFMSRQPVWAGPTETDDLEDFAPGTLIGPYVIVERLGRGGMGEVFLGSDRRLRRKVALKCLIAARGSDDERRRRIMNEARAAARISHPNVATVHDVIEHEGRAFIVMEYVEGVSLAERLRRDRLPIERVVGLGRQLAAALAAAHAKGVIHRDLKPANIQLTPEGSLKVLDFGVANASYTGSGVSSRASTASGPHGEVLVAQPGTPGYMSPEQLLGRAVDERSDIYSLGVVLFEMATGRRLYETRDVPELIRAMAGGAPRADRVEPTVPAELGDVIARALEQEPARRWGSAAEVEAALGQIEARAVSGQARALERERRPRRWGGVALMGGVLALSLIIAMAVNPGATTWRDRLFGRTPKSVVHSVAIIPLLNFSGDPKQDYFVDGMTEGLINTLGQIGALKVTARTSVMPFKRTTKSVADVARELNVDAVIEGSVMIARGSTGTERVRVTVNLIDPATQTQIWNDTIERDLVDVLTIQSEIARALAGDINVAVTPDERARLAKGQTVDPEAYKQYLLGRQEWNNRTAASLTRALDYFRAAIARDPNYAAAYAGLADTYVLLAGDFGAITREIGAAEATASAQRALALNPTLGDAYASLAFTNFFLKWDWLKAESEFRQALSLNPSYATGHQWYGDFLSDMGREDEALVEFRRAFELDPLSAIISRDLAWPLFFGRRYKEAIQQLQTTLMQHPGYLSAERLLARAEAQDGQLQEAVARFQSLQVRDDTARSRCELAWVYARAGRRADAVRELNRAGTLSNSRVYPYDVALVYAALEKADDAFAALMKAFEDKDPTMVNLKHDPRFDSLRSDPRFGNLLALMRFPA